MNFFFIIRSLPQHNTVGIAIYTSRRVIALFWHRHVQPTKTQFTISDILDIQFRWCVTIWCTNWAISNCVKQRFHRSVCYFNGFLLCVQGWVSEETWKDSLWKFWQPEITEQSITIDIIKNSWLWVIILWNILWLIIVMWWRFIPKFPRFFHLCKVDSKSAYLRNLKESVLLGI